MSVALVILAAGKGTRIGGSQNKVWLELNGRPLWQHCLEVFLKHDAITKIYWVASQTDYLAFQEKLSAYEKIEVVVGGKNRQESSYQGVQEINSQQFPITLVHDAARVFCTDSIINRILKACHTSSAVVPVIPMQDTIRQMSHHQSKLLDRSALFAVQTPQGFDTTLLKQAHETFTCHAVTDDASLMELLGIPIQHVEGSRFNFKVTTHYDLKIAQCLLKDSA